MGVRTVKPIGWVGLAGLVLVLGLSAWFIWPTPYVYTDLFGLPVRVHRFTHRIEILVPRNGYVPAEQVPEFGLRP